jgi:hypothetical protein
MGFSGAHNVRRRPQGLGVARDVGAPRIGDLRSRDDSERRRETTAPRRSRVAQIGTYVCVLECVSLATSNPRFWRRS